MIQNFRTETDSMGEMQVPAGAYYGAQTARAVENFPISGLRFSRRFIRALGLIKKHAALSNSALGCLNPKITKAIEQASQEVVDGKLDSHFVVDVFQTGSGTSTNMNANEVIANRAIELLGGTRGDRSVHPNDHVNMGQSSNDVIPTAIHLAVFEAVEYELIPSLDKLHIALKAKVQAFDHVLKIGRTHLQDATPIRLGQEFGGYASQVEHAILRLKNVGSNLGELALGGTAVGTGINTRPDFARKTIEGLVRETRLSLKEAINHFEAQGSRDACVETSGALKSVAISLIKIANDIRFLASGPRCGFGELILPPTQPGSSIMPGKINPVMCEMLIQVAAQVIGNDGVVSFGGSFGNFELNTMMPVIAYNLLQSVELLSNAVGVFTQRCIQDLQVDEKKCIAYVEQSLALSTALVPILGYDRVAALAKKAYETNKTIREIALQESGLDETTIHQLLDPKRQAG